MPKPPADPVTPRKKTKDQRWSRLTRQQGTLPSPRSKTGPTTPAPPRQKGQQDIRLHFPSGEIIAAAAGGGGVEVHEDQY